METTASIQRIVRDRARCEELMSKRPLPPWASEVPPDDFISPTTTFKLRTFENRFEKKEFTDTSGQKLTYYFFDPTLHGFPKDKTYPVLTFFHGIGNALDGVLCLGFSGAELFASNEYQHALGGAYIIVPLANEKRSIAKKINFFLQRLSKKFSRTNKLPGFVKNVSVKILNKITGLKKLRGSINNSWSQLYVEPIHQLTSSLVQSLEKNAGPVFFVGHSKGASFLYRLMEAYADSCDALVVAGSVNWGEGKVFDVIEQKNKYLFFAYSQHDEFLSFKKVDPFLERLRKIKHSFIYTPEWTRNGDKGIASSREYPEMGQHCLINSIQANLMFDDGSPMDERLPQGLTGWINSVTKEIQSEKNMEKTL